MLYVYIGIGIAVVLCIVAVWYAVKGEWPTREKKE